MIEKPEYVKNPLANLGEQERAASNPLTEYLLEKKRLEAKQAKQPTELDRAFERIALSRDGQLVLNLIMRECGYNVTGVDLVAGDISNKLLIRNESQRHIWSVIREFIPHSVRHLIEDPEPPKEQEGTEDERSSNGSASTTGL